MIFKSVYKSDIDDMKHFVNKQGFSWFVYSARLIQQMISVRHHEKKLLISSEKTAFSIESEWKHGV